MSTGITHTSVKLGIMNSPSCLGCRHAVWAYKLLMPPGTHSGSAKTHLWHAKKQLSRPGSAGLQKAHASLEQSAQGNANWTDHISPLQLRRWRAITHNPGIKLGLIRVQRRVGSRPLQGPNNLSHLLLWVVVAPLWVIVDAILGRVVIASLATILSTVGVAARAAIDRPLPFLQHCPSMK